MSSRSMEFGGRRGSRKLGVLAVAFAGFAATAMVEGQVWTGAVGDGNASTAGNWDTGITPVSGPTTGLVFPGLSGGYSVNNDFASQPFTINSLTFSSSSGSVGVTGGTFTLDGTGPAITQSGSSQVTIGSGINLNQNASLVGAGTGTLTLAGPIAASNTIGLTMAGSYNATLSATGNSFAFLAANSGTVSFVGGTHALTSQVQQANVTNSTPTVGLAMSIGNDLGQSAAVNISGGAVLTTGTVYAGNAIGSTGVLNISGAGTTLTTSGTPGLGRFGVYAGTGTVTVSSGAVVNAFSLEGGRGAGPTVSSITFTGTGTLGNFSQIQIGAAAGISSSLVIQNGATVSQTGANATTIAGGANTVGALTISNATYNHLATGSLTIGGGATSTTTFSLTNAALNVTVNGGTSTYGTGGGAGAKVNATVNNSIITVNSTTATNTTVFIGHGISSTVDYSFTNNSVMNLVKGGVQVGQASGVNSNTTINLTDSQITSTGTGSFLVAAGPGSTATININSGGRLGANIQTGYYATTTTFNINSGGLLTSPGFFNLGGSAINSITNVNVNGGGILRMVNTGQLKVGNGPTSTGNLTISANGSVVLQDSAFLTIANTNNATGTVLVDGGLLDCLGNIQLGTSFTGAFADGANAKLIARNGGSISVGGSLFGGRNVSGSAAMTGSVTIEGSGTSLSFSGLSSVMHVGYSRGATGYFNVASGASASLVSLTLGSVSATSATDAFATGSATFTGGGTQVTTSGQVAIGSGAYSKAFLLVDDGAVVTVGNDSVSFVAPGIGTTGTLAVRGTGVYNAANIQLSVNGANTGGVAILEVAGAGQVNANYISIGTPGTVAQTGGTIVATGLTRGSSTAWTGLVKLDGGTLLLDGHNLSAPSVLTTGASLQGTSGKLVINSANLVQSFANTSNPFAGTVEVKNGAVTFAGATYGGALQLNLGSIVLGENASTEDPALFVARSPNTGNTGTRVSSNVVVTQNLDITESGGAFTGFVDLEDNNMIVRNESEASVRALVKSWWSGGTRAGNGLGASFSGTTGIHELTTLAVVDNVAPDGVSIWYPEFSGVASLATTDILVMYTYLGDTNLDGTVTDADLTATLKGIRTGATGWENGDNNYDGIVNGVDLANLLTAMRLQGAPFQFVVGTPPSNGAIPEPAGLALLSLAIPLMTRRRR